MQEGGPLALVRDGDVISVDAEARTLEVDVSDADMDARRAEWSAPALKHTKGALHKYVKLVSSASEGCVTDL